MRFSTSAIVACIVAFAAAQDVSQLPSCASPCFASAIAASGCQLSDIKCQCTTGAAALAASLNQCTSTKCSPDDLQKLGMVSAGICVKAGFPVSMPPQASPTGSPSPANSTTPTYTPGGNKTVPASPTSALPQSTGAAAGNFVSGALVIAMGVLAL
ncbi:hypothetical protein ACEQ8H_007046 [Pleosporales sp. CAS-2024a]